MSCNLARRLTCATFAVLLLVSSVGAARNPCRGPCKATKKACVHTATAAYATAKALCAAEQSPGDRRSCKRTARTARATGRASCRSALPSCLADTHCVPSCGNGIVEAGETCDPVSACTTTQTACVADADTIVTTSGSAAACTFACNRAQRTCGPADGFCPTNVACGPATDVDCAGCGNSRIEIPLGEHCDPVSTCTAQQTACVSDADNVRTSSGSTAACTYQCTTVARACGPADGFCPTGCGPTMDVDCAGCGNGRIEGGETCDVAPAAIACTSITCDDGKVCTTDTRSGSNAACNVTCVHTDITACVNGDGCCAPGCNASNDDDCGVVCGNGVREGGETCEVGPATPLCTGITCDDGNACTTDVRNGSDAACNVTCTNTPITACVNGDGCCPGGGLGACNQSNDTDCAALCGNGVVEAPETCDSSPASPTCASLTCDDGNACTTDVRSGSDAACDVTCSHGDITACSPTRDGCCPAGCNANTDADCAPVCGNAVVETPAEICDTAIAGSCPTSCAQQQCVLPDLVNGGTCTAKCIDQGRRQVACVDNDDCCPAGCSDFSDDDCAPRNDACAGATDISPGGDFPFGLFNAKQNLAAAACDAAAGAGGEVFFTFTLTTPSAVYLDVFDPAGNTVDVALELYGGGCPASGAVPLDCDIGSGAKSCQDVNKWPRIVNANLDKGTYVVAARVIDNRPGRYSLRFQRVPTVCIASGALAALQQGTTCAARAGHDQYSPTCAGSGNDQTYFLVKCPATGLTVDTCSTKTAIDTVLQVNEASLDLVNGKCVPRTSGKAIGCSNDSRCLTDTGASTIADTGRGQRGIFTITVDTFGTTKCGAYELSAAILP